MIENGAYFGMPEAEYHAIPALSASGIKNILVSPMDFWARSWMNPLKEDWSSDAMIMGKAFHARITEGKDVFYAQYAECFDASVYPDALKTAEELKDALKDLDIKPKGKKEDFIKQLTEADPSIQIFDLIKDEYERQHEDKEFLKASLIAQIEIAAAMIENHPSLVKCFSGGYPEVSIIWEEDGLKMKARLDYLKIKAITDLKTFSNPYGKPIDRAIYGAMASGKYHVQAAVYLEADKHAREFAKEGKIFGYVNPDWIKAYAENSEPDFYFVFQQTGIAPLARGKKMPRNLTLDCGIADMKKAQETYVKCLKTFGEMPWIDDAPIDILADENFPIYMFES